MNLMCCFYLIRLVSVEQPSDTEESNSGHYISFLAVQCFQKSICDRKPSQHKNTSCVYVHVCPSFVKSDPNTHGVLFCVMADGDLRKK